MDIGLRATCAMHPPRVATVATLKREAYAFRGKSIPKYFVRRRRSCRYHVLTFRYFRLGSWVWSRASRQARNKLRAVAVTTVEPSALVPGLPTVASELPGYEAVSMTGFWAPARTPAAIVNKLNQEVVRALNRPDVKERFLKAGSETVGSSPEQFAAIIKADMSRINKVIKEAGLKTDL